MQKTSAVLDLPTPSPLRRESLTDQTARAIREAILNGTYALGQKLPEGELVQRFGASSSVIREALHVLQGEGIVVTRPYCGRSVFDVPPEEGEELVTIRAALEGYAAFLAARKMTAPAAASITAAAARFLSGPPADYGDWVDRELVFHQTVWGASRNHWLKRQLTQVSAPIFALRIRAYREGSLQALWQDSQEREGPENPAGHQLLSRTIVSGKAAEARQLMLVHVLGRRTAGAEVAGTGGEEI